MAQDEISTLRHLKNASVTHDCRKVSMCTCSRVTRGVIQFHFGLVSGKSETKWIDSVWLGLVSGESEKLFILRTKPNRTIIWEKSIQKKNSIWRFAHTRIFNFFHQNHFYVTPKPTMKNLKLVIKVINCVSFNPLDVCIKKKRTKGRRVEIRKTRK